MGRPFLSPELVGRDQELAGLCAALQRVQAGQGEVALVSGEAGVGKSRLVSALLDTPEAAAYAPVRVGCLESDRVEPFALVLELVAAVGGRVADLPMGGSPEAERRVRRIQHTVRESLAGAAGGRPLLLAIEDVHWSDAPSLGVLLGLAQRPGRTLLVVTSRPAPRSAAAAGFLAEINRLRATDILLGPLSRTDLARMARLVLAAEEVLPGALVDELLTATEGVPFLLEEVLRSMADGGGLERVGTTWVRRPGVPLRVPRSLEQALEARLLSKPPHVARLAALAAVIGQTVDVDLLRQLSAADEPSLLTTLATLVDLQVLEQRADGSLAFRHALTREALLARLLAHERRALHRRVAEALEAAPDTAPAVLAYHWSQAGEVTRAAPYAHAAAERAASLHAHREAIGHYAQALAGHAAPAADLHRAIGDQHAALGECAEAVARYEQAQRLYAADADADGAAEMDLRIGLVYADERRRHEARAHLAAAFATLPQGHPQRWRAGLHLALQQAAVGEGTQAEALLGEALHATVGADALARLRVGYELGGLRARRGDWAALETAGAAVLREALEGTEEALALRYDAHAALGSVAYYRGTMEQALEHFRACLRIAQARGLVADEMLARWNLATNALYHLGRWREARVHLAELQALATGPVADAAHWFELWLSGQWELALDAWLRSWCEDVEPSGDLELVMAFGRRIADLLLALGRPREALALVEPPLLRLRALAMRSFELQLAPREAEALARLGDARAVAACEESLSLARQLGARPAEALLLRARALAARAAGDWTAAFANFDDAASILAALPMAYEAGRTLREAGFARLARGRRGDRERGAANLRAAQRLFADVGAQRDEAAIAGVLAAAGLANRADRGPGPLSAREREVAELVAQGFSNREIAGRLFITEKTAAFHVGAILNKLGFDSRAQIAAYVVRFTPKWPADS